MVSSNKILTVSYGTFSCTLEGFDRSFDTMKAIAEYFRDLAQDDRYFGAEPPTPDAEMLAKIAEREIERRVEARFEQGNLVLRPTDEAESPRGDVASEQSSGAALVDAAAGAAATGLVAANTLEHNTEDEVDDLVSEVAAEESPYIEDQIEAASEALLDSDSDDLLVDAIDIEGEVTADVDVAEAVEDAIVDDLSIENLVADQAETADVDVEDMSDDQDEPQSAEELLESEIEAVEEIEDIAEVEPELIEDVQAAPVLADSVAEKLQRIRAVVASKPAEETEYTEDEHAMSGPDGDGEDENDAMDLVAELPEFADEPEMVAKIDSPEEDVSEAGLNAVDDNLFTDTIAAIVNDQIGSDDDDAILPDVPYEDEVFAEEETSEAQNEIEALRAKIAELEAQAAASVQDVEPKVSEAAEDVLHEDIEDAIAVSIEESLPSDDISEDIAEAHDDFEDDVLEEAVETAAPIVARVSKAKRSEIESALASGNIEEYDEDEDEATAQIFDSEPIPGADDSTLTAEQEAELARELADLQAEMDDDDDWNFDAPETGSDEEDDVEEPTLTVETEEEAEANIRKAVKLTNPARAMLTTSSIESDDTSLDRLDDQAETEMDEPEGNRRRSAIAHLRAAVAATKADRLLGLGKKKDNQEEPYREDLADAVRPRRPVVTQSRSERPPVRSAPLKLVAEQRIDSVTSEEDVKPVRPRRVTRSAEVVETSDDVAGADGEGFVEYAEKSGAHTLPELLEAAASYMSFVEGRDQFSRPQLMTKLHQAEGDTSSREERLRSFGQLLREGKIEKKGGGRFTASEGIGFKPDARAAG